jgi:hypothetical protein
MGPGRVREAAVGKDTDAMASRAGQHIVITGACGAGKLTLGRALARQLQLPLHRLDDDPAFRELVEAELPEGYRWTAPRARPVTRPSGGDWSRRHCPGFSRTSSRGPTSW